MFPLVKLRFTFKAKQDMHFPIYAGSALRGIFGKSLRHISCLSKKESCLHCAVSATCPYAAIFENGQIKQNAEYTDMPNPYVIEPMPMGTKDITSGETFCFDQILFGHAAYKASYVILAWNKTGNMGFTTQRTKAQLVRVEQIMWDGTVNLLHDFEDSEAECAPLDVMYDIPSKADISRIDIQLDTPLRIHRQGHPIRPENLTAYDFMITLLRRQQNMMKQHIPEAEFPSFDVLKGAVAGVTMESADLHWFDWARYSSRQKTKIALGGIVGTFTLTGNFDTLYPFLKMGELFHNGKSAVLGMGKYRIISAC